MNDLFFQNFKKIEYFQDRYDTLIESIHRGNLNTGSTDLRDFQLMNHQFVGFIFSDLNEMAIKIQEQNICELNHELFVNLRTHLCSQFHSIGGK